MTFLFFVLVLLQLLQVGFSHRCSRGFRSVCHSKLVTRCKCIQYGTCHRFYWKLHRYCYHFKRRCLRYRYSRRRYCRVYRSRYWRCRARHTKHYRMIRKRICSVCPKLHCRVFVKKYWKTHCQRFRARRITRRIRVCKSVRCRKCRPIKHLQRYRRCVRHRRRVFIGHACRRHRRCKHSKCYYKYFRKCYHGFRRFGWFRVFYYRCVNRGIRRRVCHRVCRRFKKCYRRYKHVSWFKCRYYYRYISKCRRCVRCFHVYRHKYVRARKKCRRLLHTRKVRQCKKCLKCRYRTLRQLYYKRHPYHCRWYTRYHWNCFRKRFCKHRHQRFCVNRKRRYTRRFRCCKRTRCWRHKIRHRCKCVRIRARRRVRKLPRLEYRHDIARRFAPILKFDRAARGYPMNAQLYYNINVKHGRFRRRLDNRDRYNKRKRYTYYQIFNGCRDGTLKIAYRWFYGYQPPCMDDKGKHDADWEKIVVHVSKRTMRIVRVSYTQHGDHYTVHTRAWRPTVYVGKIAHGSYHNRNTYAGPRGILQCGYYYDYRNPGRRDVFDTLHGPMINLLVLKNKGVKWAQNKEVCWNLNRDRGICQNFFKGNVCSMPSCSKAGCKWRSCDTRYELMYNKWTCLKGGFWGDIQALATQGYRYTKRGLKFIGKQGKTVYKHGKKYYKKTKKFTKKTYKKTKKFFKKFKFWAQKEKVKRDEMENKKRQESVTSIVDENWNKFITLMAVAEMMLLVCILGLVTCLCLVFARNKPEKYQQIGVEDSESSS